MDESVNCVLCFARFKQHSICPQVLDVLRSLCVCNGVAVRSNQNLITENLLPGRDLLLQTNIVNYVTRYLNYGYIAAQYKVQMIGCQPLFGFLKSASKSVHVDFWSVLNAV